MPARARPCWARDLIPPIIHRLASIVRRCELHATNSGSAPGSRTHLPRARGQSGSHRATSSAIAGSAKNRSTRPSRSHDQVRRPTCTPHRSANPLSRVSTAGPGWGSAHGPASLPLVPDPAAAASSPEWSPPSARAHSRSRWVMRPANAPTPPRPCPHPRPRPRLGQASEWTRRGGGWNGASALRLLRGACCPIEPAESGDTLPHLGLLRTRGCTVLPEAQRPTRGRRSPWWRGARETGRARERGRGTGEWEGGRGRGTDGLRGLRAFAHRPGTRSPASVFEDASGGSSRRGRAAPAVHTCPGVDAYVNTNLACWSSGAAARGSRLDRDARASRAPHRLRHRHCSRSSGNSSSSTSTSSGASSSNDGSAGGAWPLLKVEGRKAGSLNSHRTLLPHLALHFRVRVHFWPTVDVKTP